MNCCLVLVAEIVLSGSCARRNDTGSNERFVLMASELEHDNIVDLESVHFNYNNNTILLVFEYAEHDM